MVKKALACAIRLELLAISRHRKWPAISYQLSAMSYQLWAISYQLSAISYELSFRFDIEYIDGTW